MSKCVVDTSALLAYLFAETGADVVAPVLEDGLGVIGSANYAEMVSKLVDKGIPVEEVITIIDSLELEFISQDEQQAQLTGKLRSVSKAFGLSLGDRACLALGMVLGLPVLTADRVWLKAPVDIKVKCIR